MSVLHVRCCVCAGGIRQRGGGSSCLKPSGRGGYFGHEVEGDGASTGRPRCHTGPSEPRVDEHRRAACMRRANVHQSRLLPRSPMCQAFFTLGTGSEVCVFTANSFSADAFLATEHKQQRASDLDASHTQRHEDAGITDHVGRGTPSGAYGCRPADHHLKVCERSRH